MIGDCIFNIRVYRMTKNFILFSQNTREMIYSKVKFLKEFYENSFIEIFGLVSRKFCNFMQRQVKYRE